ncbi:phosphoribulokinase [Fundicoccus sp. Sow4_D5]|uniref:phosphoribulokinase n=1 Tax=unclassified Fundicoccus TaxID=2761543 RepID=UPI003F8ED071
MEAIVQKILEKLNHQTYAAKMTACHPQAHHLPALKRDIQMIRNGLDFYTIETEYMASSLISSSYPISFIEGMSITFLELGLFDLSIYLYCDSETELRRRENRDVIERGVKLTDLKEFHPQRRIQYERFMHPYSEHFDVVINTSNNNFVLEKFEV